MRRLGASVALALALVLSACASLHERLPNTAVMPPGALQTNGDVDIRALNLADYYFGHWRLLQGNPAMAAEVVAALDYMGGQLNTSPRWSSMPSLFRLNMLTARETVRAQLGIAKIVPSQQVVDTMLGLSAAYRAGDQVRVAQLLASPIFSLGTTETAQRLADLPYMPAVANATAHADGAALNPNMLPG